MPINPNVTLARLFKIVFSVVLLAAISGLTGFHYQKNVLQKKKIGSVVDSLDGVYVYYNGDISHVSGRNTQDGYNLGLKYQCVEFVKRYYYEHYGHKMPNSWGHAKDFWKPGIRDGEKNPERGLLQCNNPSQWAPQKGDLLVWDGNPWNPYGHVAIVSASGAAWIEIIQQNPGPAAPSRIHIGVSKQNGKWVVQDNGVLGWLKSRDR